MRNTTEVSLRAPLYDWRDSIDNPEDWELKDYKGFIVVKLCVYQESKIIPLHMPMDWLMEKLEGPLPKLEKDETFIPTVAVLSYYGKD